MIIADAEREDGHKLLLLGISRENFNRLQAGQPIFLSQETHGDSIPDTLHIAIIFGETEEEIMSHLEQIGCVGPDTQRHDHRFYGKAGQS